MSLPVVSPEPGPPAPRPWYRDFTVLQSALLVLLLDQFTKFLVIQTLLPGFSFPARGFFRFTHVHNTGSAFGILQGLNTPLIFVSFIGIVILVLIYRSQHHPSNWLRLSLALQLGGAFGNLIDRVRLGYVTDFIDIGPWPVFNLADASIVCGLVLLAWVLTRKGSPREQHQPAGGSVTDHGPVGGVREDHPASGGDGMPEIGPAIETVRSNDHDPELDPAGQGQRETPSTVAKDSQERPPGPESP